MKICYSLAGEGRGHAARALTIADELAKRGHEIVLYTFGDAYDFLIRESQHITGWPEIVEIEGLLFAKNGSKGINLTASALNMCKFFAKFPYSKKLAKLKDRILDDNPDIIISDFEPSLPYIGRKLDIPIISLDHQHFLEEFSFAGFGFKIKAWTYLASKVIKFYCGEPDLKIVSSFYDPGSKDMRSKTVVVGPIIRQSIRDAKMKGANEPFILAYLKDDCFPVDDILHELKQSRRNVKVYGLGEREADERLSFYDINEASFTDDLINCSIVLTSAGNQLIGEALYCGKPVLAMPIPGQYEQKINAEFLVASGAGSYVSPSMFTKEILYHFEREAADMYRPLLEEIYHKIHDGTWMTVDCIIHFLGSFEITAFD